MSKQITLWMEGFHVMEGSAQAQYCGCYQADTLEEAVKLWVAENPRERTGLTNLNSLTYWGCRFFDNEKDARATFG